MMIPGPRLDRQQQVDQILLLTINHNKGKPGTKSIRCMLRQKSQALPSLKPALSMQSQTRYQEELAQQQQIMFEYWKMMMDVILVQLQLHSKSPPQGGQNNSSKSPSRSRSKIKEDDEFEDKEEGASSHQTRKATEDKILEDIQIKLDTLKHKDTLQKVGIVRPFSLEWDLIPFLETYQAPNIDKYHGNGFSNQHIYHFHSLIRNVVGNDLLLTQLFAGSLKR